VLLDRLDVVPSCTELLGENRREHLVQEQSHASASRRRRHALSASAASR
jgi:hypothetical protein